MTSQQYPTRLPCGNRVLDLAQTHVMGILNVTPDYFSDGGRYSQLDAALRHGIDFPFRCKQGVCTSCVCRLRSGSVSYLPPEPLSDLDKAQNFTYCCLAYAESDLTLHHPFIRG